MEMREAAEMRRNISPEKTYRFICTGIGTGYYRTSDNQVIAQWEINHWRKENRDYSDLTPLP